MFIDRVKVHVKAGKGGDGIVAFRREKYVAYGGPSGGDGGAGGDVVFMVDEGKTTLLDLRYNRKMAAEPGGNGKTKKMHGADGADAVWFAQPGAHRWADAGQHCFCRTAYQRLSVENGRNGTSGSLQSSRRIVVRYLPFTELSSQLQRANLPFCRF